MFRNSNCWNVNEHAYSWYIRLFVNLSGSSLLLNVDIYKPEVWHSVPSLSLSDDRRRTWRCCGATCRSTRPGITSPSSGHPTSSSTAHWENVTWKRGSKHISAGINTQIVQIWNTVTASKGSCYPKIPSQQTFPSVLVSTGTTHWPSLYDK